MRGTFYSVFMLMCALFFATPPLHAENETSDALNYQPNERLQAFYDSLPTELQQRIADYRVKATELQSEVEEYNKRPLNGLPTSSFKTAQRKRMKIEAQMASLRLEQKEIAKQYYDLLGEGWEPPNNSNIIRLMVASTEDHPTG